jgi:hypothetical protein
MGERTNGQEQAMVDLKNFQWKNRLLLVFAPSVDDSACRLLMTEMTNQTGGVQDRDLLLGEIFERGPSRFAGAALSPQSAESFRRQFAVRPGISTVILIGKDGEVKLRREGPVQATEIFALIDSMPMRRQEMREGK